MTAQEVIEKKIDLVNNDVRHYQRQRTDLEGEVKRIKLKINSLSDAIGKKHSYKNLLQRDIEELESKL